MARHCQALHHFRHNRLPQAEAAWQEVLHLQEGDRSPLRPRTLNYLGLIRERQGRDAEAEKLYREAQRLQKPDGERQPFPATWFITLWRLANVTDRLARGEDAPRAQARQAEARQLLEEAVGVVEAVRLRTYGGDRQRATFFAQFAPAFDQLVEWGVRDGKIEEALAATTRGRSRTLLDQLQVAGVDLLQGVPGSEGEGLRQREKELREQVAALRLRAQFLPAEDPGGERAKLQADFERAQKAYTAAYRQILDASPVYRNLSGRDFAQTLATLRQQVLGPKVLLLVYHVGQTQSHLLMLGGRSEMRAGFRLTVPAGLADLAPSPLRLVAAPPGGRGLGLELAPQPQPLPQPKMPPPPPDRGPTVPLNQKVLKALVDGYLAQVSLPGFQPARGLRFEAGGPRREGTAQRPELLADVLLPAPARRRIHQEGPECLVVIPDGALHKLPFEALVLRSGARPTYVLDELPPITYVPSVAILAELAGRRPAAGGWPLSLLTVGDPAYRDGKAGDQVAQRAAPGDLLALGGRLPRLKYSADECRRIRELFEPGQVVALLRHQATRGRVVGALSGRRIVHIAAHGLADERFGNRFGFLALAPREEPPPDDGFLSLHEIYNLPLKHCELAVLSACETNVGPQSPLEAGVTLASGFLAAGARRVVASHWNVHDASTADLMVAFFQEVTAAAKRGQQVSYPLALQKARRKVRREEKWSAPCYWAPFVLVGPPA
jgi:CHAT domain-containing protein